MQQLRRVDFVGTADLQTAVVRAGFMVERLAGERCPMLPPAAREESTR